MASAARGGRNRKQEERKQEDVLLEIKFASLMNLFFVSLLYFCSLAQAQATESKTKAAMKRKSKPVFNL